MKQTGQFVGEEDTTEMKDSVMVIWYFLFKSNVYTFGCWITAVHIFLFTLAAAMHYSLTHMVGVHASSFYIWSAITYINIILYLSIQSFLVGLAMPSV